MEPECAIPVIKPVCGDSVDHVSGCLERPNSPLLTELKLLKSRKGLLYLLSSFSAASRDLALVEKNVREKSV